MPTSNKIGIFKTSSAKQLAIKYNLDLHNKNAYIHDDEYISYYDVKFIVDNLWLDHFMYGEDKPIDVSYEEYNNIYESLCNNWPDAFNLSFA